jgi:hypothetical protein
MFKIITHINNNGNAKLRLMRNFVIDSLASFKQSKHKTQVTANFQCLKASNQFGSLFYFTLLITSTFQPKF